MSRDLTRTFFGLVMAVGLLAVLTLAHGHPDPAGHHGAPHPAADSAADDRPHPASHAHAKAVRHALNSI